MSHNPANENPKSNPLRGADLVARALEQLDVDRIFSVSGNHIMPLYDAIFDTGIEIIHTRHEAACVHMADAHAKLTGKPGVALVTGGQAHANAAAALFTAYANEAPVVLLSGHAALSELGKGAFQEMRQTDLAGPVSKQSWTAERAETLGDDVVKALQIAAAGRPGPVHLSLPVDLLEQAVDGHYLELGQSTWRDAPPGAPVLSPDAIDDIVRQLSAAQRPLIIYGPELCAPRYREDIAALEQTLRVPVVGMESPRGIRDPSLGAFSDILCQTDLVVLLGKRLDFTLQFGAAPVLPPDCRFISILPDPVNELPYSERLRCHQSAAGSALRLITAHAGKSPRHSAWRDVVREAIDYRPAAWAEGRDGVSALATDSGINPVAVCQAVDDFFREHPSAILVSDGGEFGQWVQAVIRPARRLINGTSGTIGPGIPFALAAKLAEPDTPVIAMMGDGTFGFHMAEIDTAVRYGLPIVVIIGNDARWNAEHQIQLRQFGASRVHSCDLRPARYDQVVAALGGYGELVTRGDMLPAAIGRAVASGKPACLNVLIKSVPAPVIRRA